MSRLFTDPGLSSKKVLSQGDFLPRARRPIRAPSCVPDLPCRSLLHRSCRMSRSTKTRSPTASAHRQPDQIVTLPEWPRVFLHEFQSAISGFRSLCGRQLRSFSAIALNLTCLVEPFTRTGSLSRILTSSRKTTGRANPEPMLYLEGSRSGRIFQVVFCV